MGFGARSKNPGDVTPPSVPGGVTPSIAGPTSVSVSWSPSSDTSGVESYVVTVEGVETRSIDHPDTSTTFSGLSPGGTYRFAVRSIDIHGNYSQDSAWKTVTLTSTDLDVEEEWLYRSRLPGVYYGCNFSEVVKYALNNPGGPARVIEAVSSIADLNSKAGFAINADSQIDFGDGKGSIYFDTEMTLSGSRSIGHRHVWRMSGSGGDINLSPFKFAPLNYTGGADGVPGQSNLRYTVYGDQCKYVETYRNPAFVSTQNPDSNPQPIVRHTYMQVGMWVDEYFLWGRPQPYLASGNQKTFYGYGANAGTQSNKFIFMTGGASNDQVAVTMSAKSGIITIYLGNSGNDEWRKERTEALAHPSKTAIGMYIEQYHTGINKTEVTIGTDDVPSELLMQKYGPFPSIFTSGSGFTGAAAPDPVIDHRGLNLSQRCTTYLNSYELQQLGYTGQDALWDWSGHPWRQLPYGGYDLTTGMSYASLPGITDQFSGVWNPRKWKVIEILYSTTVDRAANDPNVVPGVAGPLGNPVFVAAWVADYGNAPVCLGWTHSGDPQTLQLNPDRTLKDAASPGTNTQPSFKWQDANNESYSGAGFLVVGPSMGAGYESCIPPTTTEFDIILHQRSCRSVGVLPYEPTTDRYRPEGMGSENQTDPYSGAGNFNPGTRDGWGCFVPISFRSGVLSGTPYIPISPHTGLTVQPPFQWQFGQAVIDYTTWAGFSVNNPYYNDSRSVHRVRLKEPLPVAPSAGDCVTASFRNSYCGRVRDLAGYPEAHMAYDEILWSFDEIPFPGHRNTPLPRPWET